MAAGAYEEEERNEFEEESEPLEVVEGSNPFEVSEQIRDVFGRIRGLVNVVCHAASFKSLAHRVYQCIVRRVNDEETRQKLNYFRKSTPDLEIVEFSATIDVEDPDKAARLVERLLDDIDAKEAYDAFMEYASTVEMPYTTRGHKAEVYDTGGDYPEIHVDVEYYG